MESPSKTSDASFKARIRTKLQDFQSLKGRNISKQKIQEVLEELLNEADEPETSTTAPSAAAPPQESASQAAAAAESVDQAGLAASSQEVIDPSQRAHITFIRKDPLNFSAITANTPVIQNFEFEIKRPSSIGGSADGSTLVVQKTSFKKQIATLTTGTCDSKFSEWAEPAQEEPENIILLDDDGQMYRATNYQIKGEASNLKFVHIEPPSAEGSGGEGGEGEQQQQQQQQQHQIIMSGGEDDDTSRGGGGGGTDQDWTAVTLPRSSKPRSGKRTKIYASALHARYPFSKPAAITYGSRQDAVSTLVTRADHQPVKRPRSKVNEKVKQEIASFYREHKARGHVYTAEYWRQKLDISERTTYRIMTCVDMGLQQVPKLTAGSNKKKRHPREKEICDKAREDVGITQQSLADMFETYPQVIRKILHRNGIRRFTPKEKRMMRLSLENKPYTPAVPPEVARRKAEQKKKQRVHKRITSGGSQATGGPKRLKGPKKAVLLPADGGSVGAGAETVQIISGLDGLEGLQMIDTTSFIQTGAGGHHGGLITSDGNPVILAEQGHQLQYSIYTDPETGDQHLILNPGENIGNLIQFNADGQNIQILDPSGGEGIIPEDQEDSQQQHHQVQTITLATPVVTTSGGESEPQETTATIVTTAGATTAESQPTGVVVTATPVTAIVTATTTTSSAPAVESIQQSPSIITRRSGRLRK